MSKRIAAIAGLLVAFGATAAVVVAIWPDRAEDAGTEPAPAANGAIVELQRKATSADGISGNSGGAALRMVDSRFALEPVIPAPREAAAEATAGGRGAVRRRQRRDPLAAQADGRAADRQPDQDDDRASGRGERAPPRDRVMVSRKAAHTPGSATGVLPVGKPVPLGPLLKALIMISANDAAVALAEHDSGSTAGFVARMNQRARSMGLSCTRFSTPNGLKDRWQSLLRARSGGARPSGPRQPADRRDRQDAIRETAVPDQGTAAAPREQPLLPLPWIEGSRWRAGDRPEDGLDRRRGPLLRDHGQAGWSPPRRGVARLARPDQAGAGAAPSGVRCRRSGTRARSSTAREEVMARLRELAPASNGAPARPRVKRSRAWRCVS